MRVNSLDRFPFMYYNLHETLGIVKCIIARSFSYRDLHRRSHRRAAYRTAEFLPVFSFLYKLVAAIISGADKRGDDDKDSDRSLILMPFAKRSETGDSGGDDDGA